MARAPIPIGELNRRIPEQGRIRIGKKVPIPGKPGKSRPAKLETFRFTSVDKAALETLAAKYGGTVQPWSDPLAPAGQWEVTTTATSLPIILPPDPLGETPVYEMWDGGALVKRCDGIDQVRTVATEDGGQESIDPCECAAAQRLSCKIKLRLNVILREVQFGGTWLLTSSGDNASEEMPGMVAMILQTQASGLQTAELYLSQRTRQVFTDKGGKQTRKFVVPMLRIAGATLEELAAGGGQVRALGSAPSNVVPIRPELEASNIGSGDSTADVADDVPLPNDPEFHDDNDDDIADAEIVDDTLVDQLARSIDQARKPQARLAILCNEVAKASTLVITGDDLRHLLVKRITQGRTESSKELTDAERKDAIDLLVAFKNGTRQWKLNAEGNLMIGRPQQ